MIPLTQRLWERAKELDLEAQEAARPDYADALRDDARLLREAEAMIRTLRELRMVPNE